MKRSTDINIELIKLANGIRLLRLTSPSSNLVLEQELNPKQAVLAQKKRLLPLFETVLDQSE